MTVGHLYKLPKITTQGRINILQLDDQKNPSVMPSFNHLKIGDVVFTHQQGCTAAGPFCEKNECYHHFVESLLLDDLAYQDIEDGDDQC